ncbi:hypothetical protein ACQ4M4_07635 [Leptolyngbya sp. AN02str]|uniref:hypothetical protein n=1 Tax=Leptolyngbya sp. AN02str TaxID=3423363 RepID=UPI003D32199B
MAKVNVSVSVADKGEQKKQGWMIAILGVSVVGLLGVGAIATVFYNKTSTAPVADAIASPEASPSPAAVESAPAAPPSPPAATPTPTPVASTSPNYQLALDTGMAAATFAQTAASTEDWQGVSSLWSQAIERLNTIPQGDKNYAVAQQKLTEYQRNLNYAQQQATAIQNGDNFTALGISRNQLLYNLEGYGIEFSLEEASPINGQPRIIGKASNGAVIELIGDREVTKATLVAPSARTNEGLVSGMYLAAFLTEVIPNLDSVDWLVAKAEETFRQRKEPQFSTIYGDRQVTAAVVLETGALSLTVERVK